MGVLTSKTISTTFVKINLKHKIDGNKRKMFLKNNKILEVCLDTGFQTSKRTLPIKGYLTKVNLT